MRSTCIILLLILNLFGFAPNAQGKGEANVAYGKLQCRPPEIVKYKFGGNLGDMVDKLGNRWFQDFIDANPFATEMFHIKGREPKHPEKFMWWAGEFFGKHLLSGISLYKMSGDPRLKGQIESLIEKLVAVQEPDGYWGPFPKEEQLYANNWDVWGQYHLELAFLEWYELTKDEKILGHVVKNADYLCSHFLHGRPINQVKWKEMNYAVMHTMCKLYRITGKKEYLDLAYQVLDGFKDGDAGDYFRLGLDGQPFFTSGKPRWEAFHPIQGLAELYYITGDDRYKKSYLSLIGTIRDYDIHNTGAFSTEEQAIGTPFGEGPIETCCQVAWNAVQIDGIQLMADPRIADELETGLYNAIMGYTHPSCSWCTYDTPMDGVKKPAVQDIGWQGCEGGPWLNCCTANFARGFGMLSKWALATDKPGNLYVNFYGPFSGEINIGDNNIKINQQTTYPANGKIKIDIGCSSKFNEEIKLRIPYWSKKVSVSSGTEKSDATDQGYFSIKGNGAKTFSIEIDIDMHREPLVGDELYAGKASLYYGPVLLAYDQKFNASDKIGTFDCPSLKLEKVAVNDIVDNTFYFKPMMLFKVSNTDGDDVLLCDFASAGSHGTYYKTWLDVGKAPPANVRLKSPLNNSKSKLARFQWSGVEQEDSHTTYDLIVAKDKGFKNVVADIKGLKTTNYVHGELLSPGSYYCKVTPTNKYGTGEMIGVPPHFTIEGYNAEDFADPSIFGFRKEDSLIIASPLDGNGKTGYGYLTAEKNIHAAEDRFGNPNKAVRFDGDGEIIYTLPYMPDKYSIVCWVRPEKTGELSQIFSAWSSNMDDPSKMFINDNSFVAAIENRTLRRTEVAYSGVELKKWYHLAMSYDGGCFSFYVNGEKIKESKKVKIYFTSAVNFCLGGNKCPDEGHFSGCIDDFAMYAKVLGQEKIREIYTHGLEQDN